MLESKLKSKPTTPLRKTYTFDEVRKQHGVYKAEDDPMQNTFVSCPECVVAFYNSNGRMFVISTHNNSTQSSWAERRFYLAEESITVTFGNVAEQ